ncbi:MAG: FAD-binding oxidoreductase [Nocardioidaceae bacterium]|nr:FAD-binding oxidoreductase [Nocardioidaceae bacterium]
MTSADLVAALARFGVDDVHTSDAMLTAYASDASLFRIRPQVVVRPRANDEILAALQVGQQYGVPITMRGAGTSIAGNAIGPGIVIDTSAHLDRVLELDAEAGRARVQPGTVHATLQQQALPLGRRFGPDPSTHPRCTIGGMIGNNACGSRALAYGRAADNVEALTVALADGTVLELDPESGSGTEPGHAVLERLHQLAEDNLAHIRRSFGQFTRQVSGYSLEHLLPERRRLDRFLVGSEGTLAVVLEATVRLVEEPGAVAVVVLGYPTMAEAADAVPALLAHRLIACEGLDERIVAPLRRTQTAIPDLPEGRGWLLVEVPGETRQAAEAAAAALLADAGTRYHRVVSDKAEMAALWRIREAGAGLAARSLSRPAHAGWEDAAVPPERLGEWLRTFEALLADFDLETAPYGHFGDGCVHARIDFTFDADGRKRFRGFLEAAADAVAELGGSVSGEHGDGRHRSELLSRMYDATSIDLFEQVKQICDPQGLLNPGVIANPAPVDADLRPGLALVGTGNELLDEAHRCTGVGACVARPSQLVMCPSFAATHREIDSTRGRARVLQDATTGLLPGGVTNPAVHEALDLCLACKGCATDCPTGVDMAAYKAEVLHETYAGKPGKLRPRSHYLLGRLPQLLSAVERLPGAMRTRLTKAPGAKAAAGVDARRTLPPIAPRTLRRRAADHAQPPTAAPDVWLWTETFTNQFLPDRGVATIELLERAGLRVGLIDASACCALTMITTGQLDGARKKLAATIATLSSYAATAPILALEPSCLAALRDDAPRLLRDTPHANSARDLVAHTRTLAELLTEIDYRPGDLSGVEIVAQPHCHHASILGWAKDEALLKAAGATLHRVGGCCGLAGNFGMEKGHYEVSVAVAETQLLPAVRAHPDAVVLADGLSCHHQLEDLAGVTSLHLAELLLRHALQPASR